MTSIDHLEKYLTQRNGERRGEKTDVYRINIHANGKRITLGSSGFLCKSWFKTSTHSANLPDWKCKAASLAKATVTEKIASSASVAKDPSRLAEPAAVDDDKSRPSMLRSSNQNTNRSGKFYGRKKKSPRLSE